MQTDTPGRWRVVALALSLVLHIAPLALYFVLGLLPWFGDDPSSLDDHGTIIPIDLMMTEGDMLGAPDKPEEPPPTIATLEEISKNSSDNTVGVDAATPASPPKPEDQDHGPDAEAPQDADDLSADSEPGPDPLTADASDIPEDAAADDAVGDDAGVQSAVGQEDAGEELPDADTARVASAMVDAAEASPAVSVAERDSGFDSGSSALLPAADASMLTDGAVGMRDGAAGETGGYTPIRDPIGVSGDAKKIVPRDPNLSLLLFPERFRSHRLTPQVIPLLTSLQNWKNFFGGTDLDPIRDTDRILLAGPQFRDTSHVVAVVRYNVTEAQVRQAIDSVVQRSGPVGRWEKASVPVARVHVDGAERYFVMTGPRMLVVVPPDGLDRALKLPANMRFPSTGNESLVLFVRNPANAFRGMPVRIPRGLEWMRFSLSLASNGGADCRLEVKDADATAAQANAAELTETINKAMVINLVLTQRRIIDPVTFRAEGDRIRTEFHITEKQLRHILNMISTQFEYMQQRGKSKRSPPLPLSTGAPASSGLPVK